KQEPVINIKDHYITNVEPTLITESATIQGGKINKGTPFYVFEINVDATFEMIEGSSSYKPVLVDIYGRRILTGTGSVELNPGIYVVESEQAHGSSGGSLQAKDSSVDSITITIDTKAAKQQRIDDFNTALNNIPIDLEYNSNYQELINIAQAKLDNLKEDELLLVNVDKFNQLLQQFNNLGVTYIENLINDIGNVDINSSSKITLARNKYNEANNEIKDSITNYEILINAELEFKQYEILSLNNDIEDISGYEVLNIFNLESVYELQNEYFIIVNRYENLSSNDKLKITNYEKVQTNIKELNLIILAHEIKEFINTTENANEKLAETKHAYDNYQSLSSTNKTIISEEELIKLNNLYDEYQLIISTRREELYYFGVENDFFNVENGSSSDLKPEYNYEDILINKALKLESSTKITFTTTARTKIIMVFNQGESIKVNGETIEIINNKIELVVDAGEHTITRNQNPQARLIYMLIIENY
ncbi:MAG TPA: hypothetical protein GX742_03810, partial [Acholeplasmataceae bacterium]|nr:hypothetical protein [Acholeplasmataceae bacterium]